MNFQVKRKNRPGNIVKMEGKKTKKRRKTIRKRKIKKTRRIRRPTQDAHVMTPFSQSVAQMVSLMPTCVEPNVPILKPLNTENVETTTTTGLGPRAVSVPSKSILATLCVV